MAAAQV
jgi:hypothetical protein